MDDIEDLFQGSNKFAIPMSSGNVVNRKRITFGSNLKKLNVSQVDLENYENEENGSFIPGTQSVFIKTWGCSHNNSDSEYMAGQLSTYGFRITDDRFEADLWLLNSCTVKNPAEDHLKNEINDAKRCGKKVVVAGCVSQGAPNSDFLYGLSIIGVQQIDRVVEVVEETLKGNSVRLLSEKKSDGKKRGGASLLLPKIRKNPLIEIISISTGCLNQCTYCKTKHARGELGSFPIEEIVERALQSFDEGVCEIWLTSEDTGAYGRDIGVTLPDLLKKLITVIPDGCKLRLGMTNPPYILDHLEEMGEILQHPRVYSFLHVPVQSGSDGVLAEMKREYTSSDFCRVVDTLKDRVPGITIATDIICGFPTESEEDFNDTLKLCEKYKFPSLFINQFYPRPGTPAAKLPRISTKEVKRRTRILSAFFQSYYPYSEKVGEVQTVLVTEESHDGKHWVGHNSFYEQVLISKEKHYLGKMVDVKIVEAGKHFMKGKPLEMLIPKSPGIHPALPKGKVSGLQKVSCNSNGHIILLFIYLVIGILIVKFLWIIFHMKSWNF